MTWKLRKSSKKIKPTDEGWFISWKNGKDEIEIIRYYDDDKGKWGGFEVWEQEEIADGGWNGTHLATFNNVNDAIKFAKKQLK